MIKYPLLGVLSAVLVLSLSLTSCSAINIITDKTQTSSTIPLSILSTGINNVTAGHSIVIQLGALGGTPPYTWKVVSGNLPAGLNLDASTGRITGVPSQAGQFSITFALTDKTGTSVSSKTLPWRVAPSPTSPSSTTLPGGSISQDQADLNAAQNARTAQYTQKVQSAQHFGLDYWIGLAWSGGHGPVWADIDYVGLLSVTSAYFPIPNLLPNQSLYIVPMVQGDPLQLPWNFTATGLPKGVTCDSTTGVIQGKLNTASLGSYKVSVFFRDAAGSEASFSFPISVISSKPTPAPASGSGGGSQSTGGNGTLAVSAVSNGMLYVNGGYIGQGSKTVTLAPGIYTLTCVDRNTGRTLWEKTISISAGKTTTIKVN